MYQLCRRRAVIVFCSEEYQMFTYIKAAVVLTTFSNICDACGFVPELSINSFHQRHYDTFFIGLGICLLCSSFLSFRLQVACVLPTHILPVHQSNYSSCMLVVVKTPHFCERTLSNIYLSFCPFTAAYPLNTRFIQMKTGRIIQGVYK
jgi:hypothetical protein